VSDLDRARARETRAQQDLASARKDAARDLKKMRRARALGADAVGLLAFIPVVVLIVAVNPPGWLCIAIGAAGGFAGGRLSRALRKRWTR
jgi:hypothetical protein